MTSASAQRLRWRQILETLPAESRRDLARLATGRARALGLAVVLAEGDVDIPLTLTPEVIDPATTAQRASDARQVLTSVIKAARAVLSQGVDSPGARKLFGHFGPLETAGLARWREAEDVTIARVDWFIDADGRHHALELNATIPAMEAYSDAAARAWIETMAELATTDGAATERLVAANGSNAEELRRSIVAHAGRADAERPSIAIVHRDRDSQLRELQALGRAFRAAGHDARLATADEVSLNADGRVTIGAFVPDIVYRHIFARRMPTGSAIERVARGESQSRLQNPVNGQFEVKGLLAELVRRVDEDDASGLELTASETETIRRVVPWTRLLSTEPSFTPDRQRAPNLADYVASDPGHLVLKRSWDYGGKSVLLGPDVVVAEGVEGWRRRVEDALAEGPGTWVVQALVPSPRRRHLVVHKGEDAVWEDVYVDASTYSATGSKAVPGGGVVRFARVGVVNIVGGGGVSPLISTDVADQLAALVERHLGLAPA
jgi:hypothetical protein